LINDILENSGAKDKAYIKKGIKDWFDNIFLNLIQKIYNLKYNLL
jgi:hypothetical protein